MNEWFKTSMGRAIVKAESERCIRYIPSGYYARSLQVGFPWENYLEGMEISERFIVDVQYPNKWVDRGVKRLDFAEPGKCHYAVSRCDALPFPEKTHDLIVLPHTLDFCSDPHEVLRQSSQILVPEGCIAIIGFNLLSFYGAIRLFKKHRRELPWFGNYYRVGRVQDWLALLGFDLVGAGMMSYQPPLQSEKWRDKLSFLETAGDRWCPGFGGVYMIVGRKREMAVTSLPRSSSTWRNLISGIAQPAASQRAAKVGLKLVPKN